MKARASRTNARLHDDYRVEKVDRGKIEVFRTNQGGFVAEYTVGTVKFQVPASGRTPDEAMANAKKWLTTPIGAR